MMGEEQESQENREQKAWQDKIVGLFNLLLSTYGLSVKGISRIITFPGYETLLNLSKGIFPEKTPKYIDVLIMKLENLVRSEQSKKMEKVENDPPPYQIFEDTKYPLVEELVNVSVNKARVCIYFSREIDPEPFHGGSEVIGYPTKKNEMDAIIAEPNDSKRFKDAEGIIPSYDPATPGYEIAVKRINLTNCAWGRRYYIFDTDKNAYLARLYKVEDDQYRLVYNNPKEFPDKMLKEDQIAVVFKVTGLFVPE